MTRLAELRGAGRLAPSGDTFDWEQVREALQCEVPEDYRALVEAGGAGVWFDYVRVFAPGERYDDRNLLDSVGVFEDLQIFWDNGFSVPPADLPEAARLIAWASTARAGETVFWRVDPGATVGACPIYVANADGDGWERFDMDTTDFLWGVGQGTVRSEFFSEIFLDRAQVFRPYPG